MVNISININKANNHLSPELTEQKNKKTTYDVRNPGPAWERHQNVAALNRLMGGQSSIPPDNYISNDNTYINFNTGGAGAVSCGPISSFLCSISYIIVCPVVRFLLTIVSFVLQSTDSDYPFGIFKLFFLVLCYAL